jgi:hypothetical protein
MPRNTKPLPEIATPQLVDEYHQKFVNNEQFVLGERVVRNVFTQYPGNTSLDNIMIKICVLNTIYSTRINAIYAVARKILSLKIDDRIISADKTLVNEIAQVNINKKSHRNFYSFASKYCHFHNTTYPIYDSFVEDMLVHYQIKESFMALGKGMNPKTKTHIRKHLRGYDRFSEAMESFKVKYGLQNCSTEEIDHFLWGYGRKLYPKNYS